MAFLTASRNTTIGMISNFILAAKKAEPVSLIPLSKKGEMGSFILVWWGVGAVRKKVSRIKEGEKRVLCVRFSPGI
jgi:hypothetical protein